MPFTLPYMMTGVRQAIGRALVGMIAAEFFLSATGLGQLIMGAWRLDTAGVFASNCGDRPDRGLNTARSGDQRRFRAVETIADGRDQHRYRNGPGGAGKAARRTPLAVSCRAC